MTIILKVIDIVLSIAKITVNLIYKYIGFEKKQGCLANSFNKYNKKL